MASDLFCHKGVGGGVNPFRERKKSFSGRKIEVESMKSRRLTILCVAAIALVGTPRAWQEMSNLLAAAQQKAQLKFWSMVMRPAEPVEVELVTAAESEEAAPAHVASNCSLERESVEPAGYGEARKAGPAAARPKASARRERPSSDLQGLIAHARKKAPVIDKESIELALRLGGLEERDFEFSEIGGELPARVAKAKQHARPVPAPGDTLSFVQVPDVAPVAAALSDKEATYQFKALKKALMDNKALRQRGRVPGFRGPAPFPAS